MTCHLRSRQAYFAQIKRQEEPVRQIYTLHDSSCSPMHMPHPQQQHLSHSYHIFTHSLSQFYLLRMMLMLICVPMAFRL